VKVQLDGEIRATENLYSPGARRDHPPVHFSEDNHRALGQAVAAHVKEMLREEMLPAAQ
jgi:hypothetical protein